MQIIEYNNVNNAIVKYWACSITVVIHFVLVLALEH